MAGRSGRSNTLIGPPEHGHEAGSRPSPGRTCDQEGCSTILSTYNPAKECWLHAVPAFRHPLWHSSTER
jgi:hypothetical protein